MLGKGCPSRYLSSVSASTEKIISGDAIIRMTKLFKQPVVFNEWVMKSFERFDVSNEWVTKSFERVDVSNEWVTKPFERVDVSS